MKEKRESAWAPYAASPPQTHGEHATSALKRYKVPVTLGAVLLLLIGGVLWFWFAPQSEMPVFDAVEAGLQPGSTEHSQRNQEDPYAGEAELSVRSRPSGALVILDEDTLGRTPQKKRTVNAGVHFVSVQKQGHAPADSVLILRNDRAATMLLRLAPSTESSETLPPGDYIPEENYSEENYPEQDYAPPTASPEPKSDPSPTPQPSSPPKAQPPAPAEEAQPSAQQLNEQQLNEQQPTAQQPEDGTADSSAHRYEEALRQGNERFVQAHYEEALAAYTEALEARPGDERAQERLRKTRRRIEEQKRRAEQYQYHRARGDVLFEQERYEEAISDYEQALAYRPDDDYVSERLRESRQEHEKRDRLAEQTPDELPAPKTGEDAPPVRMNLNMATAAQLQRLPGVGPVLSQRILEYRTARGPFQRVGELERVRGIGPKTMVELKPLLFVKTP